MVYLLHFEDKIGSPKHHAQHYTGTCEDTSRIEDHVRGTSGAKIVQEFRRRGINFVVARTWPGGRGVERQLKQQGHAKRICPVCTPGTSRGSIAKMRTLREPVGEEG